MRRWTTLLLAFGMVLPGLVMTTQPSLAQSDGDALCDAARDAAADDATRYQGYAIVWGSGGSGSQIVLGTEGDDVLSGGSGNDILCGFGGDDALYGGSGNDILVGGPGQDQLFGESGGDTLHGEAGEVLDGGSGRNQIITVALPTLVMTFSAVEDSGFCDYFFELRNGPPNTLLAFKATKVQPDGLVVQDSWVNSPNLVTSPDGYVFSAFLSVQEGGELTWAAMYVDATGELVAEWEGPIVCGD